MDFTTTPSRAVAAAILLLAASASPVASVSLGYAGEPATQTLNVAVLTPCCGEPEPNATGFAQANSFTKPNILQVDTLAASVAIPSSSPNLGISSEHTADIRLVFSRASVPYAECFLVPKHRHQSSSEEEPGTYVTSLVKAKVWSWTFFKQFAGFCDVDLSTSTVEPGIPAVQPGDVVTADSVVASTRTSFLQGTFVQQ